MQMYICRDTGYGAYIDGPFKRPANASKRVRYYADMGWKAVRVNAESRDKALEAFERYVERHPEVRN